MPEPTVRRGVVLIGSGLACALAVVASLIFATQTDGWTSGVVGTGGGVFFIAGVGLIQIGIGKVGLARKGEPLPPS